MIYLIQNAPVNIIEEFWVVSDNEMIKIKHIISIFRDV